MPSLQTKNFTFGTGTNVTTSATVASNPVSNILEIQPLGNDDVGIVFLKVAANSSSAVLPTTAAGCPVWLQGSRDKLTWVNVSSFNLGPTNGTGTATVYTNFSNPETNARAGAFAPPDYVSAMGVIQLFPYMRLSMVGSTLTSNVDTLLSGYIGEA